MIEADTSRRASIASFEELRAEQKAFGKKVAQAKGEEKQALLAEVKELAAQVKAAEAGYNLAEDIPEAVEIALAAIPADNPRPVTQQNLTELLTAALNGDDPHTLVSATGATEGDPS